MRAMPRVLLDAFSVFGPSLSVLKLTVSLQSRNSHCSEVKFTWLRSEVLLRMCELVQFYLVPYLVVLCLAVAMPLA